MLMLTTSVLTNVKKNTVYTNCGKDLYGPKRKDQELPLSTQSSDSLEDVKLPAGNE